MKSSWIDIREILYVFLQIHRSTMKSSFKKIEKPGSTSQKGYFGHPDLDAIFSNSLCRGHLIILQQDHPTTNYMPLLRYFVSSNYHQKIPTIIYDSNPQKWKYLIAPLKKVQKSSEKDVQKNVQKAEIAWRYDKQNINLSQLVLTDQVKFLDLTKEVQKCDQKLIVAKEYPNYSIEEFYRKIQEDFINCQEDQKDTRHKKILLSSVPSYIYKSQKLRSFLNALRCMTRSSHLTTLLTVPPLISEEVRQILLIYADYYLQIGKIGQGYTDFCSSLTILKEVQSGQIKTKNRGQTIWGIKNKKKQLRIDSLYEQVIEQTLGDESKGGKQSIQF